MIMPRGQPLLLPVNPLFIFVSLFAALFLNMLPLGRVTWMPDVLMVLLAFWGIHQPLRVGMGIAFLLGLCMDVQESALLGQHAMAYTVLLFLTQLTHRRVMWFRSAAQALQMLGLFVGVHALQLVLRLFSGGIFPGPEMIGAPLLEAALWPLASWVLLAPQRRPPSQDSNRPL